MQLVILDCERDTILCINMGILYLSKYLSSIRLLHINEPIMAKFADHFECSAANLDNVVVVSFDHSVDVVCNRIKDIVGGQLVTAKIIIKYKEEIGNNLSCSTQWERRSVVEEVVKGSIVYGVIKNIDTVYLCGEYDNLQIRPNVKIEQHNGSLKIVSYQYYYECVRYTRPMISPPLQLTMSIKDGVLSARISSNIDLQNVTIEMPSIKAVCKKIMTPDNFMHKCTIHPDHGLVWTVYRIHRGCHEYALLVEVMHELVSADACITLMYEYASKDIIDGHGQLIPTTIKYNKEPWLS